MIQPPKAKPLRPQFGSGPCVKRPGWSVAALSGALVGRSHRAPLPRARLREVITRSRELLAIPGDMRLAVVPASDTGAVEMALWSLLGQRPVDVLAFDVFSRTWARDVTQELRVEARVLDAPDGSLPPIENIDFDRDVVFAWNGTTTGVRMPATPWIPADRTGLTICDATSAVYTMALPWERLDVVTWSWQKVLGGEAAHGMLALSPRAVSRLMSYVPDRPLPKIFRLVTAGRLNEDLVDGSTIHPPSMLCVEDALDGLRWAESIGGLAALHERSARNLECLSGWVAHTPWVRFLARDARARSSTSMCLEFVGDEFTSLAPGPRRAFLDGYVGRLEREGVAFDIRHYPEAPAGLRIWGGATVDTQDIALLLPWLDWAYAQQCAAMTA